MELTLHRWCTLQDRNSILQGLINFNYSIAILLSFRYYKWSICSWAKFCGGLIINTVYIYIIQCSRKIIIIKKKISSENKTSITLFQFEWKYLFYYTQNYIIFVLEFAIFHKNKFSFLKFVFSSQVKNSQDMRKRKREILASYASTKIDFNKWIVKEQCWYFSREIEKHPQNRKLIIFLTNTSEYE